jgi:predicted phosphodiesterase
MTRALRLLIVLAAGAWSAAAASQVVATAQATEGVRFAVIGDMGTGQTPQYDVARQMLKTHASQPFEFVLMMGDNLYGSQRPRDFVDKFEIPYGPFLRMGIPFYAALGNHDEPDNRKYPNFNMNGQRFYSVARQNARFFFLDTNLLDPPQIKWFEGALRDATEPWKIVVFHHPIYSDGDRHGPNVALRVALEPLLVRYGVDVVFAGHEHIYERIKPQKGIAYFIVGSSGQLRKGGLTPSEITAAGFDQDQVFLVASIDGPDMKFQAISRIGMVVDSGVLHERAVTER